MKTSRHVVADVILDKLSRNSAHAIAAYLLDEKRTGELESLLRDVMQKRADKGDVEVTAVSAFPLTSDVRGDIEAQVRSLYPGTRHIIISERLDTSVVAGVKLEFANQQLDLSVRNKLNRLKRLTARV